MIRLATLGEVPLWRAPAKGRRERRPEHRRAMYIGGGGISIPGDPLGPATAFNGNFASLFTGVLQSVQTDLGMTYGGTPLPTAGNTSTTALTLTGSLATVPVPIWVKATNTLAIGSGAQFNIYYDGTGTTPTMTGMTPSAGTPLPLTGAGTGLSLTWSAGNSVTNDTWKAVSSALADQSGAALHYSQASPSLQPLLTTGLNGFPGLLFDGINDYFSSSLNLPASSVTPSGILAAFRCPSFVAAGKIFSMSAAAADPCELATADAANLVARNGNSPTIAHTYNVWSRARIDFSNQASDVLRIGNTQVVGNIGAGSAQSGRNIGGFSGSFFPAQIELLSLLYLNRAVTAGDQALYDAALATKYGGGVQV